jgi:hypothetical protein
MMFVLIGEAVLSAGQGEENDEADEGQDGDHEDAAFGAGGSAAEDGLAHGVRGEEMVLDHGSAVGDTVEERLRPVPGAVEADGPPEGAGAPEAEAEDHGGQAGKEQSDGGLAGVVAVAEPKEDGEDDGCGPEAQGCTVAGLKGPLVDAGEAAGESVLEVAAREVFLEQADLEEAEQPECSVTENVAGKEQAPVDNEESGFPEGQNEEGKTGDPPGLAGGKVGELAADAEAVYGDRAPFDL